MDAFSDEYEWTGAAGRFKGRTFANTEGTYHHVLVYKWQPDTEIWTHFHRWESREVGKSDGNVLAEFDAWRMHATGFVVTYEFFRNHESFKREDARWTSSV